MSERDEQLAEWQELAAGTGTSGARTPFCAARCANGGWCLLQDGHEGQHAGMPRRVPQTPPHLLFAPTRRTP